MSPSTSPAASTDAARSRRRPSPPPPLAVERPVAQVLVDTGLAHLDRPFDYSVPASMGDDAQPGVRVRVRFAGRELGGFVLARTDHSDAGRALTPLHRVVSAERVLTPEVAALADAVAARYAGTVGDVLRTAVPPRHARVEKEQRPPVEPRPLPAVDAAPWRDYPGGEALVASLATGTACAAGAAESGGAAADRLPVMSVTLLPDHGDPTGWPAALATLALASLQAGRGSLLVVPDHRDLDRLDAALTALLGPGRHVAISADLGPAERYRRFLAAVRGQVQVVVGTRAAALAPVRELGLVVCFDDGDDVLAEPRAPGWHVREVLLRRASLEGAAAVVAGFATSAERARLTASGWAGLVRADRPTVRARAPRVLVAGASDAQLKRDPMAASTRLPREALGVLRDGLAAGAPVLVQVPRHGYALSLVCADCRARVTCPQCGGPLAQPAAGRSLCCRWCGRVAVHWHCADCGGERLSAPVVGSHRTAEELGRALPGVPVRTSAGDKVIAQVPGRPALVIATPGAEPVADGGYGAAVLLDGWALLSRADMRADEEALRRWMNAAALVRPAPAGGTVLLVADPGARPVQALVGWSPDTFAEREYAERLEARLPPGARLASLEGPAEAVADLLAHARLPQPVEVLGPVPIEEPGRPVVGGADDSGEPRVRTIVRTPLGTGAALAQALRAAAATRSAAKAAGNVRIRLDPVPML